MKISVAMATYNGEKFILKQLGSIFNQSRTVDEVIISDDNSSDKTVELCRKFINDNNLTNWKIIENKDNVGYCLNFYRAIFQTHGDVIFLSDQDDEWYYNKCAVMCDTLNNNPDITVLSSRYDIIDSNSKLLPDFKIPYLGSRFDGTLEYYSTDDFIGCSCVRGFSLCFKKELLSIFQPFDLKNLLSHDWYICILGSVFGKTAVLNTKLCGYRFHGNNISLGHLSKGRNLDKIKRIKGLRESVNAHSYILSLLNDGEVELKQFINFEKQRIEFLENHKPLCWIKLFFKQSYYKRYYKGKPLRVWFGDLIYVLKA